MLRALLDVQCPACSTKYIVPSGKQHFQMTCGACGSEMRADDEWFARYAGQMVSPSGRPDQIKASAIHSRADDPFLAEAQRAADEQAKAETFNPEPRSNMMERFQVWMQQQEEAKRSEPIVKVFSPENWGKYVCRIKPDQAVLVLFHDSSRAPTPPRLCCVPSPSVLDSH